jgi:Tfp pilus assembly protein PilO
MAPLGLKVSIWICLALLGACLAWIMIGSSSQAQFNALNLDRNRQELILREVVAKRLVLQEQLDALSKTIPKPGDLPEIPAHLDLNTISETLSRVFAQHNLRLRRLLPMGSGSEGFYRFFDMRTELQGSYSDLTHFAKALGASSDYPFVIQEALLSHESPNLNPLPRHVVNQATSTPLGIHLRMRGYCCLNEQVTAAAASSTAHQSVHGIPREHAPNAQSLINDPFDVDTKAPADVKPAQLQPPISNSTPTEPKIYPVQPAITIAPIRYTRAQEVANLLSPLFGDKAGAIVVDARTNSLLLNNSGKALQDTRDAILALDVPIRQVLIEAIIVIARRDFLKRLGVRLNLGGSNAQSNLSQNSLSGSQSSGGGIEFSFLNSLGQLQIALDAMESGGYGQVISRPRLITNNLQTAYIKAGTQIPFQESAPNGRTTVQFRDAVLRLDVTPTIMPDNKIRIDLIINQDAPGAAIDTGDGRVPSIDTTELRTNILLKPNETAALGGVFRFDAARIRSKTPLLGDLPLLGRLFRHTNKSIIKSETMFFITPHLLEYE